LPIEIGFSRQSAIASAAAGRPLTARAVFGLN